MDQAQEEFYSQISADAERDMTRESEVIALVDRIQKAESSDVFSRLELQPIVVSWSRKSEDLRSRAEIIVGLLKELMALRGGGGT